ncbi:MAG: hypothetical protein IPP65_13255 [Chlorobi bacterium]|nr:hypothetical protein [Chlorobiota bacterium]
MFNKILGNKIDNKYYQKKLSDMFNTPDGKIILAWLIKTHIFSSGGQYNCTELQHAYNNGKLDFIKLLVNIVDFDFSNFEESN